MHDLFGLLSDAPEEPRSSLEVILWWEVRRIPYNLIVGMVGIVSLIFFFQFIHLAHGLKPGEDAIEPMALIAAPFALNIAYTAGWAGELHLRLLWRIRSPAIGPALLILGLSFSLLLVLLPSVSWCVIWIFRSF
jgi:hypothetical protein